MVGGSRGPTPACGGHRFPQALQGEQGSWRAISTVWLAESALFAHLRCIRVLLLVSNVLAIRSCCRQIHRRLCVCASQLAAIARHPKTPPTHLNHSSATRFHSTAVLRCHQCSTSVRLPARPVQQPLTFLCQLANHFTRHTLSLTPPRFSPCLPRNPTRPMPPPSLPPRQRVVTLTCCV